jgi:DNA-binding MarR family transcriptional regulator
MSDPSYDSVLKIYRDLVNISSFFQAEVVRIMKLAAKDVGVEGPVKFSYFHIMHELMNNERVTLTELSQSSRVSLPNVSSTINELVRLKLVKRTPDTYDHRKSYVECTELGKNYGEAILRRASGVINVICNSEDEAKEMLSRLENILARIDSYDPKKDARK